MPALTRSRVTAVLEDVRRESGSGEVGPLLYGELRAVASRVVSRYPAAVYSPNRQSVWDDDAVLEVVHECLLRQMRPDQVRLLFGYARDLDALRGMLGKRVRQTLLDIRATDVVDNLLRRLREELGAYPGVVERNGFLVLGDGTAREATEAELAAVAAQVSLVPQLDEQPAVRAPRVYGPDALRAVAELLVRGLPGGVRLAAVDRVLRRVLTHRIVVSLVPEVEASELPTSFGDPAVEDEVNTAVTAVLAALTDDEKVLVRQVLDGWTDGQIAQARGCSRPSAHAARKALVFKLQPVLADINAELGDRLTSCLYMRLSHER